MSNPDIQFKFDDDQIKLHAFYRVIKGENSPPINKPFLIRKLKDEGYEKLHCVEEGITRIIEVFENSKASEGKVCIAEKRDAEVNICITKDKLSAYLTIHPPEGGKPATLDMVKQKLAEKGVRYGFLPQAIKTAIISGKADELLIAKGEPVVNGEDAKFTCLIDNIKTRTPKISEDGHIDYRDLGEIQVVHPGEKLMRRDPATMGQLSKNVFGETITPKPGKNTKFAAGLDGVKTSNEDINTLVATVTGQPIIRENGVNVEKTMQVESVDLKSGNLLFDGSVIVLGDVASGMKVKASGDIKINGMVENAIIEAGGNIDIKGAVVGRAENNVPVVDDLVKIDALGSVSAKFVENARISSGDKIMIQDWVIKSTLNALNEIIVGKKDASKGQIIGGSITSGVLVKAMNIGSSAGAQTYIQAGNANDVEKEKDQIGIKISRVTKSLFELQKIFKDTKNNPTKQAKNILKKALLSKQEFERELTKLRSQEAILDKEKLRAKNAKVVVDIKVYSGTSIHVSQYTKDIQDDVGGRTYTVKDGKIIQIS
ncbi:MAG: FapA family protein [Gammaproteobacteria bacterium]|nr:FapA family protein [Gammaproteobacteria bacterium]